MIDDFDVERFAERVGLRHLGVAVVAALLVVTTAFAALSGGAVAATPSTTSWNAANTTQTTSQNATASAAPLIVTNSIVVSGDGGLAPGQADCALTNNFYKGQKVIFRVKVIDPSTGKELNGSQLQAVTIDIKNGGGKTLKAQYRPHGNGTFWIAPWDIPSSFPAGKVDYSISVQGHRSETVTYAVSESQLTVLNKSISTVKSEQQQAQPPTSSSQGGSSLPMGFWALFGGLGVVTLAVVGLAWNKE